MVTTAFGGVTGISPEQRAACILKNNLEKRPSYADGARAALALWAPITPPAQPGSRLPCQPGVFIYGDSADVPVEYHKPGALVIVGRVNFDRASVKAAHAAGAKILIYLNPCIFDPTNPWGKYHKSMLTGIGKFPGIPQKINSWGYAADFSVGSVLQGRFGVTIEQIATECPWIDGIFLDDLGSRPWANANWDAWTPELKLAWWKGAGTLSDTARNVANKYGLFLMMNGTWGEGARGGGGWPNIDMAGNANGDGTYCEHHDDPGQFNYWGLSYPDASQWADRSPITKGQPYNLFAVEPGTGDVAARNRFATGGAYTWGTIQSGNHYDQPVPAWTSFHPVPILTRVGT